MEEIVMIRSLKLTGQDPQSLPTDLRSIDAV